MSLPITEEELACMYAALILADDDVPITSDKITTILKAAEVEVEPIWPMLYSKALQATNVKDLITNIGSAPAAAPAAAATSGAAGGDAPAAKEEKKEEAKEESEESDDDMGFGLFD